MVMALFYPSLDRRLTQIYEQELGDRCLHKAQLLQHCQLCAQFFINIYSILCLACFGIT